MLQRINKIEELNIKSPINISKADKNWNINSQNNTIQNVSFEEASNALKTNRTNLQLVQFPSIKTNTHNVRNMLFDTNDSRSNNQSFYNLSIDNSNLNAKKSLNFVTAISSNPKIELQLPNSRDFYQNKSQINRTHKRTIDLKDRGSVMSMRSDLTDRLIDYKNDKNMRK